MGQNSERRHSSRVPCTGAAEIFQRGSRRGWGRVNEISHGGCYIEIIQLLSIGAEAQLRLTIADTLLDIGAKVVSNHPAMGMGMEFMAVSQEQKSKLAQILRSITAIAVSPAAQQAENSQPNAAAVRITREAAPRILSKIIKRINEKGVLTRQELVDIVITKQMDSIM
jgi:PilZ domain